MFSPVATRGNLTEQPPNLGREQKMMLPSFPYRGGCIDKHFAPGARMSKRYGCRAKTQQCSRHVRQGQNKCMKKIIPQKINLYLSNFGRRTKRDCGHKMGSQTPEFDKKFCPRRIFFLRNLDMRVSAAQGREKCMYLNKIGLEFAISSEIMDV